MRLILFCLLLRANSVKSFQVLHSRQFGDLERSFNALLKEEANLLGILKRSLVSSLLSLVIVEPTDQEYKDVDEVLSLSYALGTDRLPDSQQAIDSFCSERKERRSLLANFVTMKFTFNVVLRVSTTLLNIKMAQKNDFYCANQSQKEHFIEQARQIKPFNHKLTQIKRRFVRQLVAVQQTIIGAKELATLCCAFWAYKNETVSSVNRENQEFVEQMISGYFSLSTSYICFFHSEGSLVCSQTLLESKEAEIVPNFESILMNGITALSKVTSLFL